MLTFYEFQLANKRRQTVFVNKKGESFEPYNIFEMAGAAAGEAGELANECKKVRRGDVELHEVREKIGKEIADTVTYLCLVANQAGLDFEDIVRQKFNEVSDRVGSSIKV
jgi:NTP pyrophosphatase (non-canonical NTP hydrolase)